MAVNPTNILPFPTAKPTLEEAVAAFVEAKRREDAAKAERLACEELICQLQAPKEEGATTVEAGGYKVTITGSLNYKITDLPKLQELVKQLPEDRRAIFKEPKPELNETAAKYLRSKEPALWAIIAPALEVKPAKTSIKVAV